MKKAARISRLFHFSFSAYGPYFPSAAQSHPFCSWQKPLDAISNFRLTNIRSHPRVCGEYIARYMKSWGEGSRAEIAVFWKNGDGHVFVAEYNDGKVRYIDPQTGKTDVEHYFKNVIEGLTHVMRIDNLTPSKAIGDFCDPVE